MKRNDDVDKKLTELFDNDLLEYEGYWPASGSGALLPLLSVADMVAYEDLLKTVFSHDYFYADLMIRKNALNSTYSAVDCLEHLKKTRLKLLHFWSVLHQKYESQAQFYLHDLVAINEDIVAYISIDEWRKVRQKMAQIKKRATIKRIPLSNDVVEALQELMQTIGTETYSEAVDFLITAYKEQANSEEI